MRKIWIGLLGIAVALLAAQPAGATIFFQAGNQQYDNVNIAADVNALSITGAIAHTPDTMTFDTMLGPTCALPAVTEHGQHGVAFVESFADSQPSVTHTGFCSLTLTAQAGTSWFAGDFALDQLVDNPGNISATFFGNFGSITLSLPFDTQGQSQYNFFGDAGEQITSITLFVTSTDNLLQDIKQVSLGVTGIPVFVPEPLTISIFGAGLAGAVALRRRKKKST